MERIVRMVIKEISSVFFFILFYFIILCVSFYLLFIQKTRRRKINGLIIKVLTEEKLHDVY